MQFNASKCHVLQVTKKSIINHEYSLGQEKVSVVPSHPYIGIEIDNKLSWKQQLENLSIRASVHLTWCEETLLKAQQHK